jgi:hypothetical protein
MMKSIVLLFLLPVLIVCANRPNTTNMYKIDEAAIKYFQSRGSLSFKHNGRSFTAAADHARGYSVQSEKLGYLSGANADNMILDIEVTGMYKTGAVFVNVSGNDKCTVTINHISYSIKEPNDYFKITVTKVSKEGSMILLSGCFEGKLHGKTDTEAVITEGRFLTISLDADHTKLRENAVDKIYSPFNFA